MSQSGPLYSTVQSGRLISVPPHHHLATVPPNLVGIPPLWINSARRRAMDQAGVPILEQILFSKMQLYTAMYHHHKVRALECMVKAIFAARSRIISRSPAKLKVRT